MTNTFLLPRKLIVLGIVLPLAAFLGYLLATPDSMNSLTVIGLVASVLVAPLVLRFHHSFLVFSWNLAVIVFFLPGSPHLWMLLSGLSLGISVLSTFLDKQLKLIHVPSVTLPLLFLVAVVLFTAKMNGGVGLRSLGGNLYGGRKYVYILFAVMGYLAVSCQRIPLHRAGFFSSAFFLTGTSVAISYFLYFVPVLWFLYSCFPVDFAIGQAVEDTQGFLSSGISRPGGVAFAAMWGVCFLLLRFGITGLIDWRRPWRIAVCLLLILLSLSGGFRSNLVIMLLMFAFQFYFEGLARTRLVVVTALVAVTSFVLLIPLASHLPLPVQRSLSIFPLLNIDQAARADAEGTAEWRWRMWQVLVPEIPKHFWVGKGYTASATDYYLANESAMRGFGEVAESSIMAGDFHNGPLSIILPFGIWGALGFLAFIVAGTRVLHHNHRFGSPALRQINTFLLVFFLARLVYFFLIFGAFNSDMALFTGIVGLSVALNGGVAKPDDLVEKRAVAA